jgi:hypothetical protein
MKQHRVDILVGGLWLPLNPKGQQAQLQEMADFWRKYLKSEQRQQSK